jgi:hypothetical protein
VGVGFVVLGRQPGPRRELGGLGEPGDIADLGDEHRAQDRPDPGQLLHRDIAGIGDQPPAGRAGRTVDLVLEVLDQSLQRLHPSPVRGRHPEMVEELGAPQAEQVRHRNTDPALGQQRNSQDLWIGVSRDLLMAS